MKKKDVTGSLCFRFEALLGIHVPEFKCQELFCINKNKDSSCYKCSDRHSGELD